MQTEGIDLSRTSSMLAELRRLELLTRRTVDADLIGRYRSAFRGTGLLYSDIREYQPGDDTRRIHWKATARSPRVYVKSYEEDRQLRIVVAIDVSRSTGVSLSGAGSRHRRALEFAALISLLAAKSGDCLGLLLFSDHVEKYLPPKKGRGHTQRVLHDIASPRTLAPATNVASALDFLFERERRRSLIFLLSDFYTPPFDDSLRKVARKHDLITVLLDDPSEALMPSVGLVQFEDAESGASRLVDSTREQSRLKSLKAERLASLQDCCRRGHSDLIIIEQSSLQPLLQLMQLRTHRFR